MDRCHAVGQREGPPVRVPAIQDGPSSSAEDRSVTRSQGDFDRSTATGSIVVSGVDGSVPRRSDPAVRRRSRPADSRRFDRWRGDQDSSIPAVKSTRVETLRAILKAKGHSREAANMMSRCLQESSLQVYESHWWRMAHVSSQKSSFQHLYDAPLQRRTSPIDDNITSHVCGFCATSLGVWSSSRLAHQATHQSFPAGTSGAMQNHAQVGPSSCVVIIAETAIRIRRWCWRGILGWRHSPKMVDHEMCVPVSIGFGKTALIPALFECRVRQMCVRQRKHTSADVYTRESQHQRYYEEPHKPVDRGDCQGSLYTQADREYDRVTAHELWALSASWAYNCQVALPDILSAVFWGSSGVFQNSYLCDMACIADGMPTLVVTQQVVDPGHLHPPP